MPREALPEILALLDEHYPNTTCMLNYNTPFELLAATILSAQCTDERVNATTPALFARYKTVEDYAAAEPAEIAEIVRPCGFFHTKAAHISGAAREILVRFGGDVPDNVEDLITLPGVGRKTANVVLAHVFNRPAMIVDTHVKRISNKLGLTAQKDPVKIEFELMEILPKEHWTRFNTQIITHGRAVCKAIKPNCAGCFLNQICDSGRN